MKTLILIVTSIVLTQFTAAQNAPPPSSKADDQLSCSEADLRILQFKGINAELQARLDGVKGEISKLNGSLASEIQALKKCNEDIATLIGASDADIAAFRERLGRLEARVRDMQRLSDDELADRRNDVIMLHRDINALRRERISVMPEFYSRAAKLGTDVLGLYREKKIRGYVVGTWAENRDCLWNIAKRPEIYNDPFMWPKIWQANTEMIRNPDVIRSGWTLTVPPPGPLTNDEMKSERRYWRKKKAATQAALESATTAPQTTPAPPTAEPAQRKSEAGN